MIRKSNLWITVLCGIWLLVSATAAQSTAVVYTESQSGSNWEYGFTLANDSGSSFWDIYLDIPIPVTSLISFGSPEHWGDGFGSSIPMYGQLVPANTSFVDWWAESGYELASGDSLPGFSFVSDTKITDQMLYSVQSDAGVFEGTVTSAPVPEPTTLVLLASGLLGLVWGRKLLAKRE